jgi:putative ABC transport system substrate-binding protein
MRPLLRLVAILIGCLLAAPPAAGGDAVPLVAVTSYTAPPYEQAVDGLRRSLRRQGVEAQVFGAALEGDVARTGEVLQEAQRRQAAIVVVFGSLGARAVLSATRTLPVVAGMFLRAADLQGAPNATGVALERPADTHLLWLRRFLPDARVIGVVHSADNRARVQAMARAGERAGLQIRAQEVLTPREIPDGLERLARQVDVFWGIPDPMVLNNETGKEILLFSYRNRIPFVGPSASWAKAGALYALDWDYADLGAQAAELVARIVRGEAPSAIPIVAPRKVPYAVNQRTAAHMKLEVSRDLLRQAREVF